MRRRHCSENGKDSQEAYSSVPHSRFQGAAINCAEIRFLGLQPCPCPATHVTGADPLGDDLQGPSARMAKDGGTIAGIASLSWVPSRSAFCYGIAASPSASCALPEPQGERPAPLQWQSGSPLPGLGGTSARSASHEMAAPKDNRHTVNHCAIYRQRCHRFSNAGESLGIVARGASP